MAAARCKALYTYVHILRLACACLPWLTKASPSHNDGSRSPLPGGGRTDPGGVSTADLRRARPAADDEWGSATMCRGPAVGARQRCIPLVLVTPPPTLDSQAQLVGPASTTNGAPLHLRNHPSSPPRPTTTTWIRRPHHQPPPPEPATRTKTSVKPRGPVYRRRFQPRLPDNGHDSESTPRLPQRPRARGVICQALGASLGSTWCMHVQPVLSLISCWPRGTIEILRFPTESSTPWTRRLAVILGNRLVWWPWLARPLPWPVKSLIGAWCGLLSERHPVPREPVLTDSRLPARPCLAVAKAQWTSSKALPQSTYGVHIVAGVS